MSEDLPDGWTELQLASVASLVTGSTPSTKSAHFYDGGTVPFVKPGDLGTSRPITAAESLVTLEGAAEGRLLPPGSSLVCCIGSIGKQGFLGCEAIANQQINAAIPGPAVLPRYLFHALSTLTRWLDEHSSQTTIRIINKGRFSEAPIRLAPLPEQHRIVEKAEALLEQVNRAKERLNRVPLILKRFRQAVLAAACSGELTREWRESYPPSNGASWCPVREEPELGKLPNGWGWSRFTDVCEDITVGHVGPMASQYVERGVPFLRSQNVRPFRFDPKGLKYITPSFHQKLAKSALKPGDIAIVRSGNAGEACVIPPDLPEANCADLVVMRPSPVLNPYFAIIFINSVAARAHIDEVKVGIAQGHFNIGSARETLVPLPPLAEQEAIVQGVQRLFDFADTIQRRVQVATSCANKLPQAILSKAFSGELVPTEAELARLEGRTYETAEELLKRVTALGSDAASAGKGRGRRARKAE